MKSIKAKKSRKFNGKTLIVTLDVGKHFHFGYFRAPNGTEVEPFKLYNTKKSFNGFWRRAVQFAKAQRLEHIVVGFESTGPYAEPLCHFLNDKPVQLVQINPMHTKRVKELTGNSPQKTDRKDPRVIADVIALGHSLTVVIPKQASAELRRLSHGRQRAIKKRTAAVNQLRDLVFLLFPEFSTIIKDMACQSAFYLLRHYPRPEDVVAANAQLLIQAVRKVSRGRIGAEHVQRLIDAARRSVGISQGTESIVLELQQLIREIQFHDQFIGHLKDQMRHTLEQIPYSDLLLSIRGLGVVTVAGLIGEVGDFRQFETISEVMKMAGLNLYEISSGQRKGQRRISKRGRSLMRKLLYFAALNTVKAGGIMHGPYQQMVKRGMKKIKALTAISRKLLAVIFALVRDNTVYVESYCQMHEFKRAA
jgi:transposase